MKLLKIVFVILSVLLLVYLVWPHSPSGIEDFPKLPDSARSNLSGDTWQVPNTKAYFSNNYRGFVMPFYIEDYQEQTALGIKPLVLIYPPEHAYTAIKVQTQSTYLEEITYPLRDSLFVNGMEPFDEETGEKRFEGAVPFTIYDEVFETKVTMRYYPSPIWARFVVWMGIVGSILLLWKMTKKVIIEK